MSSKQTNPWIKEVLFAAVLILLSIITSLVLNNWSISIILWTFVYIIWKWIELYHFYRWYIQGSYSKYPPLTTGVFEILSNHVIKNNKYNNKLLKKNKTLLHQFESTAQALPYATILLNDKFEIQWFNQETKKLFGIVQKDLNCKIDKIIQDIDFIKILNEIDDIVDIKINNPSINNIKTQIRIVKLSNNSFLLVARDISEQESLRKSRKSFVANASHELRTPLTVITGYLEMLVNNDEIDPQWQTAVTQARSQAQRMEKIIADMLKLSGMEHEQFLEREDLDIQMPLLLNKTLNEIKNTNKTNNYQFTANISSELTIYGDSSEIISLVQNLINNALIHNPKGATIDIKWFKKDDNARLEIRDDGVGIKQKHLTHLTQRFYRVDNSRNKNTHSTGLGLAIVKQICLNHQAQLKIESEINKGTYITISFPISKIV